MKVFKKVMIEMIPVILGIWIALFINDWKQKTENEQFLANVLESIDKEMELNVEEINKTLPKQYALIDTIKFYIADDKISLTDSFNKAKGLQVPGVKNTLWKSFSNSKMELVNFEVISKLTDIEEGKGLMNKKLEVLMGFFVEHSESTEIKRKKQIIMQLYNLLDSEQELLKNHKEYLELENKTSH